MVCVQGRSVRVGTCAGEECEGGTCAGEECEGGMCAGEECEVRIWRWYYRLM